jgi:hypothetical protein
MDERTEMEREADIQAAVGYREMAKEPIEDNMPGRKEWLLQQAERLENDR